MNIMVCVKQVPDAKNVRIDPETNTLIRQGVDSILNPFDLYAVEAALAIKDQTGGKVTAVTMGPPQAEAVLREAVSYGVDEAALLCDRKFAGADTWATSYALALAAQKLGPFDVIICGKQAIDGDTAQVGPGLAARLNLPYVAFARKLVNVAEDSITVERLMDDGYDVVEMRPPCLLTVVKEIGQIRVPSFKGKMKAKKLQPQVLGAEDLGADEDCCGLTGSPTRVVKIFAPKPRENREVWTDAPEKAAERLLNKLAEDKVISVNL